MWIFAIKPWGFPKSSCIPVWTLNSGEHEIRAKNTYWEALSPRSLRSTYTRKRLCTLSRRPLSAANAFLAGRWEGCTSEAEFFNAQHRLVLYLVTFLLPQSFWDHRQVPQCLVSVVLGIEPWVACMLSKHYQTGYMPGPGQFRIQNKMYLRLWETSIYSRVPLSIQHTECL